MKLGFLLFLIPFLALIALTSFVIFKVGVVFGILRTPLARHIVGWIFTLLPVVLMVTMVIGNKYYSIINSFLYDIAVTWLPILIYLFLGAVLLSLINLVAVWTGHPINMFPLSVVVIVISFGATLFGIINATMPRIVSYDINSPTLSPMWSGKNIVLVSDTHLGVVRSSHFMQKVVNKINGQNPDLVLIAGDIIDGPVFNYAKGLAPLANIKSTFGVVYTPGNHEAYNREPEKFYPIVKLLTTTLVDSKTELNGTNIIGLDYKPESFEATVARLGNVGFDKNVPTIALLHDPKNTDALLAAGVSLVVSGHTHCGQFFPINLLVKRIYKKHTYGVFEQDKNGGGVSVTTCGVGTAMSPLRLGTNPEIVVLHIK